MTYAKQRGDVFVLNVVTSSHLKMPPLSAKDKAFVVAQFYAGKTAVDIQRKFKRELHKTFSLPTISRWLKRVPTQFEKKCTLSREVREEGQN